MRSEQGAKFWAFRVKKYAVGIMNPGMQKTSVCHKLDAACKFERVSFRSEVPTSPGRIMMTTMKISLLCPVDSFPPMCD